MTRKPTTVQRLLADRLPAERPANISAGEWGLLVAHVRDRVPYAELARRGGLPVPQVRQQLAVLVRQLVAGGELALLPTDLRRLLERAGYQTLAAVAATPDAALLRVRGIGPDRLRRLRAVVPYREWDAGAVTGGR